MALLNVSYYSHALTRNTDLTVILPAGMPDFIAMPNRKAVPRDQSKPFRTIYLLHGYSGTNADWLRYTRIELFSMLYNIAVVCPSGENSFYLDDRMRDAYYTKLVCDELIDFTRRIFPLSHRREDTLIGGLSMGGYGAVRNGLLRNDVFGTVIALSSALVTDQVAAGHKDEYGMISPEYFIHTFGPPEKIKGSDMDPEALINRIVRENLPRPNLYVAIGTEDPLLDFNRQFHGWLEKAGYGHVYIEAPGNHDWVFWDEQIEKAFIWYNELSK